MQTTLIFITIASFLFPSISFSKSQFTPPEINDISALKLTMTSSKTIYKSEDHLSLQVKSNQQCYLTLIDFGSSGESYIIFPNAYQKNNLIKENEMLTIPSDKDKYSFEVGKNLGNEVIWAICNKNERFITTTSYSFSESPFIKLGKITSSSKLSNLFELPLINISDTYNKQQEVREKVTVKIVENITAHSQSYH